MKRLVKSTIWAGALLSALLLVQTPSAQAQLCYETCTYSTPCSTGCEVDGWGYTTCGDFSYPCCQESAYTGSGQCLTRHWKASTQVCKEKLYQYDQYANLCDNTTSTSFTLLFAYNYSSSQEQCPEYNDCPE